VEEVVPAVEEVVPAAEEPQTVSEVLDEVPAGTEVVVLDEAGEALPLASAEAAEVIVESDPIWCPENVNPSTAIAGQCTDGFNTVTQLFAALATKSGNGTIFFTSTYVLTDAIFDNTTNNSLLNLGNLTLQGGWNGKGNTAVVGGTVVNGLFELSGSTTFTTAPVEVIWGAKNVTIKDMIFNGGSASKPGLYVETTTGNVVMQNVNASFNTGETGAYVETTTGDVTVNNSQFNSNSNAVTDKAAGLEIKSNGNVTLYNVTANYNTGNGAQIYGKTTTTGPKSVTVSDSTFNFNTSNFKDPITNDAFGDGLWIDNVQGDVTLNNVTAMYNSQNGVEVGLKSNEGKVGNGTTGNILVNGGTFAYNGNDGLHLSADQNITLNNVTTYGNRDDGAELCAGQDININGGNYYQNTYGTYIRCGNNVNSYYGNWWGNYYWGYYWDYPYWGGNYYGYYGNYWNGWALPIWGNVTISNIYVDGYFMPNYSSYYSFYNSYYYGYGWNPNPYYGWGSGYWYWRWLRKYQPVVQTKPMTVETTPLTEEELPEALPEDKTFADAFELKTDGGAPGEVAKASFDAPADLADGDTVTVLSWDGTEWTEVPSEIVDGKVEFKVEGSGTFALATP